jgi:hypothetical protein
MVAIRRWYLEQIARLEATETVVAPSSDADEVTQNA